MKALTMMEATGLINQFKAEPTGRLENIDKSQKPSIVRKLEDFADDESVIEFLLSVASDEMEFDLARVEVFKILELKEYVSPGIRHKIAKVIHEVLSHSHEILVRNYAAIAASSYMDNEDIAAEIDRILHDEELDVDLRSNAFGAVELAGPTPQSIESFRRLLADEEFKVSAARVLTDWKVDWHS